MLRDRARARAFVLALAVAAAVTLATVSIAVVARGRHRPNALRAGQHDARTADRPGPAEHGRESASALPVAALVRRLSTAQLAGQRIIYSYAGLTPPRTLLARIRAGEAAGVVFFAPNVASRAQIRAVIDELQAANAASPVHAPLLMLTDQEGGLVRRLPGPPALSERQIGEGVDANRLASEAGRGAGLNLAATGINVNLAPVLDVYRVRGDFIDEYHRSYGPDASAVATLGAAFIRAQQQTGVAATAKHFPGLGVAEAGQNTDLRPVTIDAPLTALRAVDEAPYRNALAAGVRLVMLSWAVYPALDPRLPAGLSTAVIQGELRRRLGFRGVTITDGIGAGALTSVAPFAQRGVLAAGAGADLLLCAATDPKEDSPADGVAAMHALASALAAGRLSVANALQSAERIIALRASRQPAG